MTDDIVKCVRYVGMVKAYAGGDVPEDVLGAINKAILLSWNAPNKIIFYIGDAPLRGIQFCGNKKWCRMANILDKKGPKAKDLLASMKKKGIKYNILMINDKLIQMVMS